VKTVLAWIAGLVMLAAGIQGLVNALQNLGDTLTGGQWAMTMAQLGYALATPLVLLARWRRHPALIDGLWGWGAAVALATMLAPVVWGGASWWVGLVAGAGAALAVLLVAAALVGSFRPLLERAPSLGSMRVPTNVDRSGTAP
jgi:hypothetical protein